jgi:hypothetical protein
MIVQPSVGRPEGFELGWFVVRVAALKEWNWL